MWVNLFMLMENSTFYSTNQQLKKLKRNSVCIIALENTMILLILSISVLFLRFICLVDSERLALQVLQFQNQHHLQILQYRPQIARFWKLREIYKNL